MRFLFISLLVLLISCTRNTAPNNSRLDTLTVGLGDAPKTLDPRFATDAYGIRISHLLFSSLVLRGADLSIVPSFAKSWSLKDKIYRFEIEGPLRFSNGRALTADDIAFSFAQYRQPSNPYASGLSAIKKVRVEYDGRAGFVEIELKEFSATFLESLTLVKILPQAEVLAQGDRFALEPIGSGPYIFKKFDASEIRLQAASAASERFRSPKTPNLVFKIVRDDNTRFLKFLKGEIDIVQNEIPLQKIAELEKKSGLQVIKQPGTSMSYLLLNLQDPTLSKLENRRALAQAFDRKAIVEHKLSGLAELATSLLTPKNRYFNHELVQVELQADQARKILSQIRPTLTLKTSNLESAVENGKVLSSQLQAAGLKVKMQSFEWGTFYDDIQKGNFQMATMRWVGTTDPDIYRLAFHSKELPPTGRNRGRYKNARLDQLLETGVQIEDEAKRIRHYQEVQKIVYDDLAIIPLWYDLAVGVAQSNIRGYKMPLNGDYSAFVEISKESL